MWPVTQPKSLFLGLQEMLFFYRCWLQLGDGVLVTGVWLETQWNVTMGQYSYQTGSLFNDLMVEVGDNDVMEAATTPVRFTCDTTHAADPVHKLHKHNLLERRMMSSASIVMLAMKTSPCMKWSVKLGSRCANKPDVLLGLHENSILES
jgi:hypothetical protein